MLTVYANTSDRLILWDCDLSVCFQNRRVRSCLPYGCVQKILSNNLQMRRVSAKFVPRTLTGEHKENHVSVCRELKKCLETELEFIANIITESGTDRYDSGRKMQNSQGKTSYSPRHKKTFQLNLNVKVMLIIFFKQEHCAIRVLSKGNNCKFQILKKRTEKLFTVFFITLRI